MFQASRFFVERETGAMPFKSTLSLPVLEVLQSLLQLRMSAVSADIYAEGAKPSPNVIQIARWRAKRSELALEADGFAVLFAIERARAGAYLAS